MNEHQKDDHEDQIVSPINQVFGIVSGPDSAEDAMAALTDKGTSPDHVRVLTGWPEADNIVAGTENAGGIAKIVKFMSDHLSEENQYLREYKAAVTAGRAVLIVEVSSPEEAETVMTVMQEKGAESVRHFGRWQITDQPARTDGAAQTLST